MHGILAAMGIEYERIAAVDGRTSPAVNTLNARRLSPAEKGCLLSHREAWRRIAEGQEAYAAVLEDDIMAAPDLAEFLDASRWLASGMDIIKLETTGRPVVVGHQTVLEAGRRKVVALMSAHMGSAAYIIARDAARRLLATPDATRWPVDDLLFDPRFTRKAELSVFQVTPAPCAQAPQSEIASIIRDDRRRHHNRPTVLAGHTLEKAAKRIRRTIERQRALRAGGIGVSIEFSQTP